MTSTKEEDTQIWVSRLYLKFSETVWTETEYVYFPLTKRLTGIGNFFFIHKSQTIRYFSKTMHFHFI